MIGVFILIFLIIEIDSIIPTIRHNITQHSTNSTLQCSTENTLHHQYGQYVTLLYITLLYITWCMNTSPKSNSEPWP